MVYFEQRSELQLITDVVGGYASHVESTFNPLLSPVGNGYVPAEFKDYIDELRKCIRALRKELDKGEEYGPFELHDRYAPLLRQAVVHARLEKARDLELRRGRTIHPAMLKQLDAELFPFDRLINSHWFPLAPVRRGPQLADFFPIELVEAELAKAAGMERPRVYDEKFHILQAPDLLLYDLDRARRAAALRNILIAVAYIDIDKFGGFNKAHGNIFVDRMVLPKFMRYVEAHVYQRGYAYRHGGDEYCILLNNVTEDDALSSMERLRVGISELAYEGTQLKTTVSVGVVIVRPDSYLTGHEIVTFAEAAKAHAKEKGRNRVATYMNAVPREGEVRISSSAPDGGAQ